MEKLLRRKVDAYLVAWKTNPDRKPLVIKGPGAGPEVTAAGVFSDILRLSAYLGSKI